MIEDFHKGGNELEQIRERNEELESPCGNRVNAT